MDEMEKDFWEDEERPASFTDGVQVDDMDDADDMDDMDDADDMDDMDDMDDDANDQWNEGFAASARSDLPAAQRLMEQDLQARIDLPQGTVPFAEQMRELQAIDPSFRGIDDLARAAKKGQFHQMVLRGYTVADAYKLANFDTLTSRRAAAAKQAAVNAANSKGHFTKTGAGAATGGVHVPAEVLAEYKRYGYSAKEAAADYAKMKKG